MPLKLCSVLLAVALAPSVIHSVAVAQPVPVPLPAPAPIERAIEPRVVVPTEPPSMRLDQEEEEPAYPGYYGWRTYAPSYYGYGVARPYYAARPFYGFAYSPERYAGFYRPFYYRHGFYFRGRPFGYAPFGDGYGIGGCGDHDD